MSWSAEKKEINYINYSKIIFRPKKHKSSRDKCHEKRAIESKELSHSKQHQRTVVDKTGCDSNMKEV